MEIELNQLVAHLAGSLFRVKGVYRYAIAPGQTGKQKSAPYPGFIFPVSGRAQYQFNGTPYLAYLGNVLHGGANMYMDKRVIGKNRWEFISVLYEVVEEPEDLRLSDTHFELEVGQNIRLPELLFRLWDVYNKPGALPAFQVEVLFRRILEEVIFLCQNRTSNGARILFENAADFIHGHYMEPINIQDLAGRNGVNTNRLFYVFQKYAGMGPADYLIGYRLNRAKELLVTTDLPVGEIAESVGYADALYFSRVFKKRFGVSPSMIRE
ncbi:AraC family transcriptional regulator [Lachnospiraceae bacterium 54-53]